MYFSRLVRLPPVLKKHVCQLLFIYLFFCAGDQARCGLALSWMHLLMKQWGIVGQFSARACVCCEHFSSHDWVLKVQAITMQLQRLCQQIKGVHKVADLPPLYQTFKVSLMVSRTIPKDHQTKHMLGSKYCSLSRNMQLKS